MLYDKIVSLIFLQFDHRFIPISELYNRLG